MRRKQFIFSLWCLCFVIIFHTLSRTISPHIVPGNSGKQFCGMLDYFFNLIEIILIRDSNSIVHMNAKKR